MNSLEAAMRMLRLVDRSRPVLRVGEVSRELGLQKSTVSRLLRTMSEHELIERERHGQGYVAGRRGLVLADLYLSGHSLLELVDGAIEALVSEFEFVGYVGVLSGSDIVLLRVRHGRYPLRLVQEVGKRIPAILTSIGLALLARKSDAEVSELLRDKSGAGPSGITARLDEVRRNGTAAISSAIIPGIGAIGTAVGGPGGGEALGFALSYPVSAADEKLKTRMVSRMREEGMRIGQRLGDPAWSGLDPSARVIELPSLRPPQRRGPRDRKAAG
jgi:DNA-binding IclR family transcriptional regulator